jgi:uncharacterized protein (TIGR03083 family)
MTDHSNDQNITAAGIRQQVEQAWNDLQQFYSGLTEEQLTTPTDAAGWTVKDHMVHLAVWETGLLGVLDGGTQNDRMNIDAAVWDEGEDDPINEVIQKRYQHLSLDEARAYVQSVHDEVMAKLDTMTDDDLQRQISPNKPYPVYRQITGDTTSHYAEHIPWMQAIADTK